MTHFVVLYILWWIDCFCSLVFGLVCLVGLSLARPAGDEEYAEYEEEPAPPPKKPARAPLIGRRNPPGARNNKPASSTTTTPQPNVNIDWFSLITLALNFIGNVLKLCVRHARGESYYQINNSNTFDNIE